MVFKFKKERENNENDRIFKNGIRSPCGGAERQNTGKSENYVEEEQASNNLAVFMSRRRSSIDVTEIHCHGNMFYSSCDIRSIGLNLMEVTHGKN